MRDHDVGRAGDDLDAGLDGAREPAGRPYSTIHTAAPTAIGVAIAIPITVSRTVPEDRVEEAAGLDFWSAERLRARGQQARAAGTAGP